MSKFEVGDKVKIDKEFLEQYSFCANPSFVWEVTKLHAAFVIIEGPGGKWSIELTCIGKWSISHFKKYNENPIWCE